MNHLLYPSLKTRLLLLSCLISCLALGQQMAYTVPETIHQDQRASLIDVLTKLEQNLNISFDYDAAMIQGKTVKATQVKDAPTDVEAYLNTLLRRHQLRAKRFEDNTYVIYLARQVQPKKLENKFFRQEASLSHKLVPSVIQAPQSLRTQSTIVQTISGQVTDLSTSDPLPGVNVLAKGTATGTVTDIEGNYRLTLEDEVTTLVFSSIGYETTEEAINGRTTINLTLSADVQSLSEVVVVGYGTKQKADITGAQGTVDMDIDLQSRPMVEMGQAMYGKLPGVQVLNGNGRPGSSTSIQIRGINSISANSSPLIVVDGIPLPTYDLNILNPADIKSIEVLKDAASAAIYGSRGANGVVLVTTISGQSGKAKVSLNYSYGLQEVIDRIDVMDSYEYAQASIDAAQNGWIETGGNPNAPNTIEARGQYKYTWPEELENPESLPNTNWQDLIFRVAPMQKIDLNVAGGT
ncbi:MAG: carboxypeptidase-like regulatory domain-containing protein, partial [Tunicatimonas sp.]|uniref:carboxypeptidase-like regulatory domain-containing protein n=1 Tax=Tunicatimonas sp. TaxID=1940096 RepID=UPI003C7800EE